ncbi:MFS transporter [Nemorincola caseinilytica]|uniref:MFS transporter n=1 Tax=Nemorincola caseinilytica TaxID=2054315 RepID=A0ABP8NM31_9BACT
MRTLTTLYKNAYTGLAPATWWLSLVMLINRSGTMVVPFMTLYLTDTMHCTIARAALVMAIFGAGAICGGILGGKLTDKFGFYNIQLVSLLCGGILFMVLGQLKDYTHICICTFVLAALNETFRPANATAVAHYSTDANRTRCYSLNRLAVNLGWAFGGALGGFIASKNYSLLFWIDGITNIGAAILLLAVLSPSRNSATPSHKDAGPKVKSHSAFSDVPFMVFIALTVLFGTMFFQLFATIPVFFKQKLLLSPSQIGITMAFNGILITLIEMPLVYTLEQRSGYMRFIVAGCLLCAFSFVVLNMGTGGMLLALFSTVLVTAGEMLSMPFMNTFWSGRTNSHNRGQYAGLYTAAWSVAQVIGPYSGGQAAQHLGFYTLWLAVGAIGAICALGFNWLRLNKDRYPLASKA